MLNDDGNAFLIRNLIWINVEVVLVLIRTVNLKKEKKMQKNIYTT